MKKKCIIFIGCMFLLILSAMTITADETATGHYSTQTYPGSWYQNGSSWYWRGNNGINLKSSFLDYAGHTYFLKSTGVMSTGWEEIDGNWYYFQTWGGMYKSTFFEYRSHTYYVDENGIMAIGWKQIDGNWYYFQTWGGMYKNTFFEYLNHTYYVDENGVMATGWNQINGNWYYFQSWGGMVKDSFIDYRTHNYYVDSDGIMLTGWNTINGDIYYFQSWGGGAKGWNNLSRPDVPYNFSDAYWNYFDESGRLVTDSDSLGCEHGYNNWQDCVNETIETSRHYIYRIDGCNQYRSGIYSAINMWQDNTDVTFTESARNINFLFMENSIPDSSTLAQTYFYYFDEFGENQFYPSTDHHNWLYVGVSINSAFTALEVTDAIIAHEIGHTFGLSHQITDVQSIMSSPAWLGVATQLSNSDLLNYEHLY